MATREIQQFAVTIPHGTAEATPATTPFALGVRIVKRIEIRIPPGPQGLVGFQLQNAGQVVIPWNTANWIVANDESMAWDIAGYVESGSWALVGYNTGTNDHTIYVRFLLDLPPDPTPPAPTPIPAAQLSGVSP